MAVLLQHLLQLVALGFLFGQVFLQLHQRRRFFFGLRPRNGQIALHARQELPIRDLQGIFIALQALAPQADLA